MININHTLEIKKILTDTLGLDKRLDAMGSDVILLGNIPELDSVAIVTIILALEQKFSISIKDDEISAKTFEKLSSLANFVEIKLAEKNRQLA
ncbi:Phosphopantetheine attachment site [Nitrosomonas ureae]|uniref:Phosphopantetheine attachment site n=1 Tax=Nitrosomonas ureae TaxID=44577 RepID=A0A285BWF4_9PROT|nr:phosphopantetheine-binding protein [Nitrosomonas ureae]SNX59173.1 Phosphopantetheine attachment site [Nitrosomonas ureae]